MSGRAGRRGIDKKGVIITMLDEKTDLKSYITMFKTMGKYDPLIS